MNRTLLALSIAALGIGFAGARTVAHAPQPRRVAVEEHTSGGNVARIIAPASSPTDDREGIRRTLRDKESGTYISEILMERDSALARWPDRPGDPLSVWIEPVSHLQDWDVAYVQQVRDAFTAWDTLALPVRFRIVADSAEAQIHVTWIDRFTEPISGRTRWARDASYWITDASIILAVHHRTGETLELDAMHAMALHEIGHLLGLDHTSDPSSVMAAKVRVRGLSDADRNTARLLYSVPAGSLAAGARDVASR